MLELKIRKAFATQKCHATKVRGIPFLLTIEQWWDIWQQSGQWENRGPHTGQYVMSRYKDQGPYEVGNVFIQTAGDNQRDTSAARKGKPANNKGKSPPKYTCVQCSGLFSKANITRWHNETMCTKEKANV